MHETLADLAYRHSTRPSGSAIPRINLHSAKTTSWPVPTLYRPMLGLVLRGSKSITIGNRRMHYGPDQYFIGSIEVPASSAIVEASPDAPYVSVRLLIDQDILADLVAEMPGSPDSNVHAFELAGTTPELHDAWYRMLKLLDAPDEISTLAPLIEREILFRILRGPQGAVLRQASDADQRIRQIRRVIAHLRAHFTRSVAIAEMADIAGMSPATFHRHFREVTAMSPLQYQKALRLQEARRLMIAEGDATRAAYAVGYESTSQFSREYARMFGRSPGRDAAMLRMPQE